MLPRFGEHELLRPTIKKRHTQEVLEHDDMAADRALRDSQAVGSRRETQMFACSFKSAQGIQRQPFAIQNDISPCGGSADAGRGEPFLVERIAQAWLITQDDPAVLIEEHELRLHGSEDRSPSIADVRRPSTRRLG